MLVNIFTFLNSFGVAVYVSFGGLRATFISDASHTFIILIFIIVFYVEVYVLNDKIGSAQRCGSYWNLYLQSKTIAGSYLTFRSEQGAIFAVISVITGIGFGCC